MQSKTHVVALANNAPHGLGDAFGFEFGRGHLVEQGQKGVVIVFVEDKNLGGLFGKGFGRPYATKTCPEDEYLSHSKEPI